MFSYSGQHPSSKRECARERPNGKRVCALPTQWSFAEAAATEHGQTVSRDDWRVLTAFHLADSADQARKDQLSAVEAQIKALESASSPSPAGSPMVAESSLARSGAKALFCLNGRRLEPHMAQPLFETELKRNAGLYEADMPVQLVLLNALSTAYTC